MLRVLALLSTNFCLLWLIYWRVEILANGLEKKDEFLVRTKRAQKRGLILGMLLVWLIAQILLMAIAE